MNKAAYDLWDVETGNIIGTFDIELDALRLVHDVLEVNGTDYAAALDLGWVDDQGDSHTIVAGSALLERVQDLMTKDRSLAAIAADRH